MESTPPNDSKKPDGTPKKNPFSRFNSQREICPECQRAIYAAERQVVGKQPFHRLCAGIFIEREKKAPVFSLAEERNVNKNDPHYQKRESNFLPLVQTNIANFGSKEEKELKLKAAKGEPAWIGAGEADGIQIWRIEKFKVVAVPKDTYGSFYEGDSYIVLRTTYKGVDQQKKKIFGYEVHFWLGRTTTQDEAGTAAYKTVELDDILGGAAVQHREVMDYESPLFLSYFESQGGLRILNGGVDSGFRIVTAKEYRPRLLWIKGRKNVRVVEVPISKDSMNDSDCFVLDMGLSLYQWQGRESAPPERLRAALLCRAIDSERSGKVKLHVIDESDHGHLDAPVLEFWKHMGYQEKQTVQPGDALAGDMEWEKRDDAHLLQLFRLSDASGVMTFALEATGREVTLDKLDSNDVFVLDAGPEIFCWIGKGASPEERKTGMKHADEYMKGAQRPSYLPISLILDGAENDVFKSFFTHQ